MAKRKRKQDGPTGAERQEAIVELIRAVPEGFVTTYGDLCPEAPRLPGRVLATTTEKRRIGRLCLTGTSGPATSRRPR